MKRQLMKYSNPVQLESVSDKEWLLIGELIFTTVTQVYQQSLEYFQDSVSVPRSIDLGRITRVDSAGLALIIGWIRLGKKHDIKIHFQNIPAQMTPLAKLCGVDHLLI